MKNTIKKKARQSFVRQIEETDCGIASLISILRYYGGSSSRQQLRYWSGSTPMGTNMLGLSQTAQKLGLNPEAYIGTVEQLKEAQFPCILHVVSPKQQGHYWVAYGQLQNQKWLIGDPAQGLLEINDEELSSHWKSGALLAFTPDFSLLPKANTASHQNFWQQLWAYTKPNKPALISVLVLGLITAFLGLATSLCTQKLVDDWLPSQSAKALGLGIGFLAWLLILRLGLNFFRNRILLKHNWQLNEHLMNHFFQGMLQMPLLFHQMRTKADWMQRMRDSQRVQQLISLLAGQAGVDVISLLASLALLSYYHWSIGLLGLVLSPIYYLITQYQQQRIAQEQREAMSRQAHQESFHLEALQQMESIQSGLAESRFLQRSAHAFKSWMKAIWDLGLSKLYTNLALEALGLMALVALLGLCAYGIFAHGWALGLLVGSLTAWGVASTASHRLGMLTFQIQESKIALERLAEATEGNQELQKAGKLCVRGNYRGLIVYGLDLQLQGQPKALLHIPHFSVLKGEVVAVVGASGSGKSTFMQVLQGHRTAEKGLVTSLWTDKTTEHRFHLPLDSLDQQFWRKQIAYVPQKPQVFTGTVIDNISLFDKEIHWKEVMGFCQQMGIHGMIEALPQGYFSMVGEGGIPLSEGQKQLLALARALFQQPQLLFLDEPTASLDAHTASLVLNILQKAKNKMGIVLISHRAADQAIADRVYAIEQGRLVDKRLVVSEVPTTAMAGASPTAVTVGAGYKAPR